MREDDFNMQSITTEEHFILTDVQESIMELNKPDPDGVPLKTMLAALEEKTGFAHEDDLDEHKKRIKFMNDNDIRMQILSYGNNPPSNLTGEKAIELCQLCNDVLHEYVELRPTRFQGFAVLPINEPEAAAEEFRRCINELGMKGALIAGRGHDGTFLDHPQYEPIFKAASELNAPIYLHPAPVTPEIYQSYYKSPSYDEVTSSTFACFGYGWHTDVGVHAVRLVLSGLFDRYPNLEMIIGHWGEFVPFFLERMDQALLDSKLEHPISTYFEKHFYITPSGMFTKPQFDMVRHYFGIDKILYAVDYPYIKPDDVSTFLDTLGLTEEEKEKIAYKNAEKLFNIDTEQS